MRSLPMMCLISGEGDVPEQDYIFIWLGVLFVVYLDCNFIFSFFRV
jgi:hypothetical protein